MVTQLIWWYDELRAYRAGKEPTEVYGDFLYLVNLCKPMILALTYLIAFIHDEYRVCDKQVVVAN